MQTFWRRPVFLVPVILFTSLLLSSVIFLGCVYLDPSDTLADWYVQPGMWLDRWLSETIPSYENRLEAFGGEYFMWLFPAILAAVMYAGIIALVGGISFYRVLTLQD